MERKVKKGNLYIFSIIFPSLPEKAAFFMLFLCFFKKKEGFKVVLEGK